jgi:hypothetical protein
MEWESCPEVARNADVDAVSKDSADPPAQEYKQIAQSPIQLAQAQRRSRRLPRIADAALARIYGHHFIKAA